MINREAQTVSVVSFATGTDSYGQKRKGTQTTRDIEMVVKIYNQSNVSDIRYNDVTTIGLTKDKLITDANQIQIGADKYNILYVIPSSRYYQILMKKV